VADFYAYGVTGPPKVDLALRYARRALTYNEESALEKITEYQNILSGDANASMAFSSPEIPVPESTMPPPDPPSLPTKTGPDPEDFEVTRLPSPYTPQTPSPSTPPISTPTNLSATAPLASSSAVNEVSTQDRMELQTDPTPPSTLGDQKSSAEMCESAKNLYWGRGVQVDYATAHKLFLESASAGNAESSRYLGLMFLRGKGVEKNLQTSVEWFEQAAKGGDSLAQKNLVTLQAILGN
jgi:type IV secretory pathway VirB10-like protein